MFCEVLTDRELYALERKHRALQRKQEKVPIGKFPQLDEEVSKLYWQIEEAKAIRNGTYPRFEAEKTVYAFVKNTPDKVLFEYLRNVGLNVVRLIDAVEENPDFIKQTFKESMEWLPIVRVESDAVFVKTIRGIEPVCKTRDFCSGANVGDYALCKSVENRLYMYDYYSQGGIV